MTDHELIEQLCKDLNQAHDELMIEKGATRERAAGLDWAAWTPQANSIRAAEVVLGKKLAKTDAWTNFPSQAEARKDPCASGRINAQHPS